MEQGVQLVCAIEEYVPNPQTDGDADVEGQYEPAGHIVHKDCPPDENEPERQAPQLFWIFPTNPGLQLPHNVEEPASISVI